MNKLSEQYLWKLFETGTLKQQSFAGYKLNKEYNAGIDNDTINGIDDGEVPGKI